MITIRKPLSFSEIGRKDNQEDYLFPAAATTDTRVFILCDGMGGHDNGEVASRTAAEALGEYLTSCSRVDEPIFEAALDKAYKALDGIDTLSDKKPGTTMTCLCLNDNSFLAAHIGDSRIYQIRPSLFDPAKGRGGVIYQTTDHSLVNDLLKAGEITEEEARDFPHKNIITRAMQPHLERRYEADIFTSADIRQGDYFFLCCDGVLEQLSNDHLCEILADGSTTDEQKLAAIKAVCDGQTRDNYSCWLIPVDKVAVEAEGALSPVIMADEETAAVAAPSSRRPARAPLPAVGPCGARSDRRASLLRKIALWAAALAALCVLAWGAVKLYKTLVPAKEEGTIRVTGIAATVPKGLHP